MDIKPPVKKNTTQTSSSVDPASLPPVDETDDHSPLLLSARSLTGQRKKKLLTLSLIGGAVVLLISAIVTTIWYHRALSPLSSDKRDVRVIVEPGQTAASIAETLYSHELIRSRLAFNVYTQLSGNRAKLQAGGYVLSPDQNVQSIVDHMTTGKTDEFNITILPGLTVSELKVQFEKDGYSRAEIADAFDADYDHPLLASRPQGMSLEGYIYPETYRMNASQTLRELFVRSFDQMYMTLQDSKYLDEYAKRNLTIHEAITLASIVQKEVKDPVDQKQVAQVFLKRLKDGMQLGSDVTFMYAAQQMNVRATPSLDSPYNTRKYAGLPPGPISNMNPSALEAVAFPAPGDFVYFVAGDDGKTYFSRTESEHEANVSAHCTTLCQ